MDEFLKNGGDDCLVENLKVEASLALKSKQFLEHKARRLLKDGVYKRVNESGMASALVLGK